MPDSLTCLLIDDDSDDQEIFSIALQDVSANIKCVFANDGVHALQQFQTNESFIPHYIFIDMNMPRMDGNQCLHAIKQITRLKDIPVYMYSTSADPTIVAETKAQGAADFIIKPTSISALTGILSHLIGNKKQD